MSTATAPTVTKSEQAIQLRANVQALTGEVQQLNKKLAEASGALALLEGKRQKFTEDAVAGRDPKPGAIAALAVSIEEATIPFAGLTSAVNSRQAALDQARTTLRELEYELSIESQREARQARFQALEAQGTEAAARIAEKIRALIQDDLPALDQVRDSLTREFVNVSGVLNAGPGNQETTAARSLINELKGQFFDGPFLAVERRLLRAGWQPREDLVFTIKNLRPPRQ